MKHRPPPRKIWLRAEVNTTGRASRQIQQPDDDGQRNEFAATAADQLARHPRMR
jgi:hypothetical protein